MTAAKFLSLVALFIFIPTAFVPTVAGAEGRHEYKRTLEKYEIPSVTLVNQQGKRIGLKSLLDSDKPVLLDFIYGTCTTICPVLSAVFANFQTRLGPENAAGVRLVSISIDPENDTPEVMRKYLERYQARPGWDFLTGTREDINRVMRAFDAYVPNKMAHYPLTLLHAPKADHWVRIDGLIGGSDLMDEYRKLPKK
jgi:protein SCO1/2